MEIVIKIDDENYKIISDRVKAIRDEISENGYANNDVVPIGWGSIADGTPLPKGHGRLIDVNDLLDDINLEDNDYNRDVNTGEIITLENIDRIPTIIEAEVQG